MIFDELLICVDLYHEALNDLADAIGEESLVSEVIHEQFNQANRQF